MNKILLLAIATSFLVTGSIYAQQERSEWSKQQAKDWYATKGWLRGSNFIPSSAINQLEMWQTATFDASTIDRELAMPNQSGLTPCVFFSITLPGRRTRKDLRVE